MPKEIEVGGIKLHFARNEAEWKKEIDKRYDYDTKYYDYHHVVSRSKAPILKLCIENGVKIPRALHIPEKSLDLAERIKFHKYIRLMVDSKTWGILRTIYQVSKVDPRCKKLVGEQLNA